ncbi:MAG: helix-turn-helix transcriptional regulator [Bacteroidales bacterium]|nr:helix-turn-helix transcriptional regulator [Bacteroidales bacterium]
MVNLSLIKVLCAEKGVSVRKMAIASGLTQSTVASMIKNNSTTLDNLEKIAAYFGVSVGVFFGEENKAEKILSVLNNAFANDKKRAEEVCESIKQATKLYEQMGADNDPKLKKKFQQYQESQIKGTLDNCYIDTLLKLKREDLQQLVSLEYISEDISSMIDFAQKELKKMGL